MEADQIPSSEARFLCNPLISDNDGGRSTSLRPGRRSVRQQGHFEGTDDGSLVSDDDLPARPAMVEAAIELRMKVMFDAYIAAADIHSPAEAAPAVSWRPAESGA